MSVAGHDTRSQGFGRLFAIRIERYHRSRWAIVSLAPRRLTPRRLALPSLAPRRSVPLNLAIMSLDSLRSVPRRSATLRLVSLRSRYKNRTAKIRAAEVGPDERACGQEVGPAEINALEVSAAKIGHTAINSRRSALQRSAPSSAPLRSRPADSLVDNLPYQPPFGFEDGPRVDQRVLQGGDSRGWPQLDRLRAGWHGSSRHRQNLARRRSGLTKIGPTEVGTAKIRSASLARQGWPQLRLAPLRSAPSRSSVDVS